MNLTETSSATNTAQAILAKEIAQLMNSNPDSIYKRMQRAISKLREIIEEMERTEK